MVWIGIACFGRGGGVGWGWGVGWLTGCKTSIELCVFCLSSFPTFLSFLTSFVTFVNSDFNAYSLLTNVCQ